MTGGGGADHQTGAAACLGAAARAEAWGAVLDSSAAPPASGAANAKARHALARLVQDFLDRDGVITICPPCGQGGLPLAPTRYDAPDRVAGRRKAARAAGLKGGRRPLPPAKRGGA